MLLQLASIFAYSISLAVPTPDYYDYSENYVYANDPAYKLEVVCENVDSNMVKCSFIPFLEELRYD